MLSIIDLTDNDITDNRLGTVYEVQPPATTDIPQHCPL